MDVHPKHLYTILLCAVALTAHIAVAQAPLAAPAAPATNIPTIQVNINAILLPVIVRDAQGHVINNLKKEDFKVFDQGKLRPISGFSVQTSAAQAGNANATQPASTSPTSPAPPIPATPQSAASPKRFIVFLFDDRHLGLADTDRVKQAGIHMLDHPLAETDRAVALSFLGVNSGITRDPAVLKAAVLKLKPQERFLHDSMSCPDIDYYAADQILNKQNAIEYQIAFQTASVCAHFSSKSLNDPNTTREIDQLVRTTAMRSLRTGEDDALTSLTYIRDVVHTMSRFPGQRTLILISPGFLSISEQAMTLESQILNLAAASNVTINTLDARGLFNTMMSASQSGAGSSIGLQTGSTLQSHGDSMKANADEMADLADGTGGAFFHNNNDLETGFESLIAAPESMYLLEVSLQGIKQNGTYHSLKVEVDQSAMKVQARRGYFAPSPPKNGK